MSNTKLHGFNQVDEATITATSEDASFPLSNLKDYRRTKVYRSLSNNDSVVFDFGESVPIDSFMTVFNQRSGWGMTSLIVELNGSNAWGSPLVSEAVTLDPLYGFANLQLDTPVSVRYARVVMQNTAGYCELSNLFFGQSQQLGVIDFDYPLDYKNESNATVSKNRIGQRFVDKIGNQRLIGGDLRNMTRDEAEEVLELLDYCGEVRPVWLRIEQTTITQNPNRLNGCYFFKSIPSAKYSQGGYWSVPIDLEEAM